MSNDELQKLVEMISKRDFKRPFRHCATFNPRLRTTGGRYYLRTHEIEINPKMLTEFDYSTLIGVIKHELCHYHLHLMGDSGNHRSKRFQQLLQRVGGMRYAPQRSRFHYYYQCYHCHQLYPRQRRVDLQKMVCGKCHARLKLIQINK